MPRKKKRPKLNLPPFVCLKKGEWHVRRVYPTQERDSRGRIKYISITRKCEPPSPERAAAIAAFIDREASEASSPKSVSTLADFFKVFFEAKRPHVSRITIEYYERLYDRLIKPSKLAEMRLTDIQPIHIQMFFSSLASPDATKRKVYAVITMAFRQALLWRLVKETPVIGVMLPRTRKRRTSPLSEAEAKAAIKACRTDLKYLIIEFGLETGLRPEELIPLTWSDIDLEGRTVSVNKVYIERLKGGGFEIGKPKTPTSHRVVSFSEQLKDRLILQRGNIDVLKVQLKVDLDRPLVRRMQWQLGVNHKKRLRHRKIALEQVKRIDELDLVFPSATGGYRSIKNVNQRLVKELLKEAGLDTAKYSFKSLRHSFASILAKYINPAELQKLMGHSDSRTTFNYYVHAEEESRAKASEQITKALYED